MITHMEKDEQQVAKWQGEDLWPIATRHHGP